MKTTIHFQALGTAVEGGFRTSTKAGAQKILENVKKHIEAFEARFSRFRNDSELSLLNARSGNRTRVSREMIDVLAAARRVWMQTDGFVDPTVGNAVVATGYNASFERLPSPSQHLSAQTAVRTATMADVRIDVQQHEVLVPRGIALDIGGIGKGYLLDTLAPVIATITPHYWLSLGGDLIESGYDERGHPWYVLVQNPHDQDRDLGQIRPPQGRWSIATSGTLKRKGIHAGESWHHLIDPKTAKPAMTDIDAVTAIAPTGIAAEAVAKAVLLQGSKEGIGWAERQPHVEALAVLRDGNLVLTRGMDVLLTLF